MLFRSDINVKSKWKHYFSHLFNKIYDCKVVDGTIITKGSLAGVARKPFLHYEMSTVIFEGGEIKITLKADMPEFETYLPRLGFEFKTPCKNDQFTYFGMGEHENYWDMCHHTKIGMYESSADKEYVNYIMPQEHGNHTKTKLLQMKNGLTFTTDGEFEFNVSRFNSKSLTEATHTDKLVKDDCTNVRIDYKVSGIGSNSCGPQMMDKYKLTDENIVFSFSIK